MPGGHGGRSARRKLDAIKNGRVPGRRGRSGIICMNGKRTIGSGRANNTYRNVSRILDSDEDGMNSNPRRVGPADDITYHRLALFECPADNDSNLSACVARHGGSAVRVSKPNGSDPNLPGPIPIRGHAVTWHLDLHHPSASKRVSEYLARWKPRHLWLSIPCTSRTQVQYFNKRNFINGRPRNEKKQRRLLGKARTWARQQLSRKSDGVHSEQSAKSHEPFDSANKPWVINRSYSSVVVRGCSVGLRETKGQRRLLSKAWSVESSHGHLLTCLRKLKCTCPPGYKHGLCIGVQAAPSGRYTAEFASIVIGTLWPSAFE